MLGSVIALLATAIGATNEWYMQFQNAIPGIQGFFLAGVAAYICVTKLLGPIIGGRGSDQVKKGTKSKGQKKDG